MFFTDLLYLCESSHARKAKGPLSWICLSGIIGTHHLFQLLNMQLFFQITVVFSFSINKQHGCLRPPPFILMLSVRVLSKKTFT